MMKHFSLSFKKGKLTILDQRLLPLKTKYLRIKTLEQSYKAIARLSVRGAPLIGIFAAYSIYVSIKDAKTKSKSAFLHRVGESIAYLKTSRPTAVNLFWALDRIKNKVAQNKDKSIGQLKNIIKKEALSIHSQDIRLCKEIGRWGAKLVKSKDSILTHCNTGFLATGGQGTALSIIYQAKRKYPGIKIYADESRPLLQGARLTCWELTTRGIKVTLICDSTAAFLMKTKKIDKVFVGADRITKDGFVANKIGTYQLAISAGYHKIPFYVAAPSSSFDLSLKGSSIPIEERSAQEVTSILGKQITSPDTEAWNPAFDITPPRLITAIVTEKGIIKPPYPKNIKRVIGNE
jgi:methylthioribose-1-phosphate isomerase